MILKWLFGSKAKHPEIGKLIQFIRASDRHYDAEARIANAILHYPFKVALLKNLSALSDAELKVKLNEAYAYAQGDNFRTDLDRTLEFLTLYSKEHPADEITTELVLFYEKLQKWHNNLLKQIVWDSAHQDPAIARRDISEFKSLVNEEGKLLFTPSDRLPGNKLDIPQYLRKINSLKIPGSIQTPSTTINRIASVIGFPFGIRATAQKYLRVSGRMLIGGSGSEGTSENNPSAVHFYVVDERALSSFASVIDQTLYWTVVSAVVQYSQQHAPLNQSHFEEFGFFQQDDLPVLYIFYAPYYRRAPYEDIYAKFEGHDIFPEAVGSDETHINPKGVFMVTPEDYRTADASARKKVRANFEKLKTEDQYLREYIFKAGVAETLRYLSYLWVLQVKLGDAVPIQYRFAKPTEETIKKCAGDEIALRKNFPGASRIQDAFNFFRDTVYELLAIRLLDYCKNM
ncbi:hypothetical protein HY493_03815 [Candidatus Woesearchaeota archaeon]|nr:hypothetical protein [Candidatus Woesearchaeota archaeon]